MFFVSLTTFAQKPKTAGKPAGSSTGAAAKAADDKTEFEKAAAVGDPAERIKAFEKFIAAFPKSPEKVHAQELLTVARAQVGDQKLKNNETEIGVKLFKLAVRDAPLPVSDKLFSEILLPIPSNLFFRGQAADALETARTIETKIGGNAKQNLGLAAFYLGIENASEAERLAEKALASEPNLPAAYQTLGIAQRLNFEPDDALKSYAKALELDQNSAVSKRSLAEMNRAVGNADEAVRLYRELLANDQTDAQSQTGLALALFDADKQAEAETETAKSFAANPNNIPLLIGAAYWYAAHENGGRAVELASAAVKIEPRYVWAQIALARGFMQQKRPLDAERVLLAARQYGNFPTLNYELAAARLQAGFFREAAETLATDFKIENNLITAKLGGRVVRQSNDFIELLAPERRAGIFEPIAADNAENAARMKSLLDFKQKLSAANADETVISQSADAFIEGDDRMKLHRQLFVARQLLEQKKDSPKISEIAQSAVGKADAALDVPNAAAAVLADALYDSRAVAASRNEVVVVPEVPRPTLSAILRGEIEEIAGWSAYQQNKTDEAVVHLKRAVSVLPEKSSYWRSSMWRLGASLEAAGKDGEALDAYLKSYPIDAPSAAKYLIIEALYKKINGSGDGLEAKIGVRPAMVGGQTESPETAGVAARKTQVSPAEPKVSLTPETVPAAETAVEQPVKIIENPAAPPVIKTETETATMNDETEKINPPPSNPAVSKSGDLPPVSDNQTTAPPQKSAAAPPTARVTRIRQNPRVIVRNNADPSKPLFEPVVIRVGSAEKSAPLKTGTPEIKEETKPETKPEAKPEIVETVKEPPPIEKPAPTEKAGESKTNDTAVKPEINRPRVFITENVVLPPDAPTAAESIPPVKCGLEVSSTSITLINNGGSLGVIVKSDSAGENGGVTASSNNPNDVSITLDGNIGAASGRMLFIIKSISTNPGIYKVTFTTDCGQKELAVRVR